MMVQIGKLVIFLTISIGLVLLSRDSLRTSRAHGFYRFFAWECILILLLLNIEYWFIDPFSARNLLSWAFLILSGYLVLSGIVQLRRYGQADESRSEVPLIGMEKTTTLVTNGIYGRIRHPLYSSLVFLAWGIFLKNPGWLQCGLAVAAMLLLVATAKVEEEENLRYFGETYATYIKKTRMFIPYLL